MACDHGASAVGEVRMIRAKLELTYPGDAVVIVVERPPMTCPADCNEVQTTPIRLLDQLFNNREPLVNCTLIDRHSGKHFDLPPDTSWRLVEVQAQPTYHTIGRGDKGERRYTFERVA